MADRIGQHFGEYRLVRLIGQGDFGEVYLGEHLRHSGQAAIKVLHTRLRDVGALYFFDEAHRIYNLKHPNLVRLLDYDFKDDFPFLIMDYLPNGTLRQRYPEGTCLPLADILSFVEQVANVLQYAHNHNVIHRDVKPQNMLIGLNDEILLSDFGLAIASQSMSSQHMQNRAGTLLYMAPEQFEGKAYPASDQYALGVVVYEWLCGIPPFQGTYHEIAMQHQLASPPALREKMPAIPAALEQVVLTALAKDPKGRFPSVQDFANDLERAIPIPSHSIEDQPKVDSPNTSTSSGISIPERSRQPRPKFTRRDAVKWGLVILAGAISTTTIIAVVIESHASNPPATPTPKTPTTPSPTPPPLGTTLYIYRRHSAEVKAVAWSPDGTRIASGSADKTVQVWDAATGDHVVTCSGHSAEVRAVAWSPRDGQRIVSGSLDTTVRVWNAITGSIILTYRGHSQRVRSVAWSPDGTRIASASEDKTVRVWNAITESTILTYRGHSDKVITVAWSPDGTRIASASFDGTVQVWNSTIGGNPLIYHRHHGSVRAVAWSPDGQYLASGGADTTVQVWDATLGQLIHTYSGHRQDVQAVAWSPDGTRIASASFDTTVKVWDAATGRNVYTYTRHSKQVWAVAWSPRDGQRIASGSIDDTVQVWQAVDRGR
jgi:eukaryotic-like serine/threonine-protein kinase